eukprot:g972.t1
MTGDVFIEVDSHDNWLHLGKAGQGKEKFKYSGTVDEESFLKARRPLWEFPANFNDVPAGWICRWTTLEGAERKPKAKYLSSLATKLQTVTAINTAVEDAVKRQLQEEIEAQRQLLRKEGYEKAVAEKFNIENISDYFVKSWIRENLNIMNKGFQVVVDTLAAQSEESKRIEGEFIYKEKEPPKVNGSGKGKATRHNR